MPALQTQRIPQKRMQHSKTTTNSQKTLAVTEDQSAAMEELYATVQNSVELAEVIRKLFTKK